MRVSMEYFMKKRNLKWSAFGGLEYDRYVQWCHVRRIIPIEEKEFLVNVSEKIPVEEPKKTIPQNPIHLDPKALGRKKKADLVELANVYGIELGGTETKKQIVSLIIDVNNE